LARAEFKERTGQTLRYFYPVDLWRKGLIEKSSLEKYQTEKQCPEDFYIIEIDSSYLTETSDGLPLHSVLALYKKV
jgi:hypothetical protein